MPYSPIENKIVTGEAMSCNAFELYGVACGMDGKSASYVPRDIFLPNNYDAHVQSNPTSYSLTPIQETNTFKPVSLYVPPSVPTARDLGFSYHPTLDVALSYLSKRNEGNKNIPPERTNNPQTLSHKLQTTNSFPPDLAPAPAWEQERQELEQLIAQEKKVQHHAAS